MAVEPLVTPRLTLRPPCLDDALDLQALIGDWEVVKNLARVPHPYEDGMAEEWIASLQDKRETGQAYTFAIERREDGVFLGIVSLDRDESAAFELGYWLGRPYWRQGYMTEAGTRILQFGFEDLRLDRIVSSALPANRASIGVLTKTGMVLDGREERDFIARGSRFEVSVFTLLRADFVGRAGG